MSPHHLTTAKRILMTFSGGHSYDGDRGDFCERDWTCGCRAMARNITLLWLLHCTMKRAVHWCILRAERAKRVFCNVVSTVAATQIFEFGFL